MFVDGIDSGFTAFHIIQKRNAQLLADFQKLPSFKRETDYYKAHIGKVTGVEALLKDRRLLTITLSAFQLEDQVDSVGLIRKFLTQDPSDPKSLASRMLDPRWKSFANAFKSLKSDGGAALKAPGSINAVLGAYTTNEFEKGMGESNGAVREALYFMRTAGSIKSTIQMLGDKVQTKVARVALGLPETLGALSVDQQVAAYKRVHLDVTKFKDPKFLAAFVDRFLSSSDHQNAPSTGSPNMALTLLQAANGNGTAPANGPGGLLNLFV